MARSRVRKKNGKKVKYTPNPTGISKTKMKKLMEIIEAHQKNNPSQESDIKQISDTIENPKDQENKES